jgi:hypothetical protein
LLDVDGRPVASAVDLFANVVASCPVQLAYMAVFLFAADVPDELCAFLVLETGSIAGVNAVILILAYADEELLASCAARALLFQLLPIAHPGVVLAALLVG